MQVEIQIHINYLYLYLYLYVYLYLYLYLYLQLYLYLYLYLDFYSEYVYFPDIAQIHLLANHSEEMYSSLRSFSHREDTWQR